MAKIHTHYDNLKVSRHAPQEVIRASYKALSQKYHPDKNPGDEKSARIMAVVNTAYNVLSDPVRRKEHDEWIAAEEWEVEWLESSNAKEGQPRKNADNWEGQPPPKPRRKRLWRDPRWWLGMSGCFVAGAVVAVLTIEQQPNIIPSALAWGGIAQDPVKTGRPDALGVDASSDDWARRIGPDGAKGPPPEVRALAVTQLAVPARAPDCSTDLQTLASPSGDPWPLESSYLPGYPVGNEGTEMQVVVDNSANAAPVFVKLYDLDRRANVRHAFVQQRSNFTFDKLVAGKYEVRYQNVVDGASKSECDGRHTALRQAAADIQ